MCSSRQRAAHLEPVHPGQQQVEHDRGVLLLASAPQAGRPVVGDVDVEPLGREPARDRVGETFLVLDHQHAHARIVHVPRPEVVAAHLRGLSGVLSSVSARMRHGAPHATSTSIQHHSFSPSSSSPHSPGAAATTESSRTSPASARAPTRRRIPPSRPTRPTRPTHPTRPPRPMRRRVGQ